MLPPEDRRDAPFQHIAGAKPLALATFQRTKRRASFPQSRRDSALLSRQQLLALDHDERSIERAELVTNARDANALQGALQRLHHTMLRRFLERR